MNIYITYNRLEIKTFIWYIETYYFLPVHYKDHFSAMNCCFS